MDLREEKVGGVTVVDVKGRIDSTTAPSLGQALAGTLAGARNVLVLDFSATEYLSSAGLRVLLLAARQVEQAGGKLVVCELNDRVREVFAVSGFDSILTVCAQRDEALALAAK